MPDTIDIHRVEMWDHKTEVINCTNIMHYPPYERITITVHTADNRQTVITLYQDVACDMCGLQISTDEKWTEHNDRFTHTECLNEHIKSHDDWVDRFALRQKKDSGRPEPDHTEVEKQNLYQRMSRMM